jgi:broad specificity phosphatase PhoE
MTVFVFVRHAQGTHNVTHAYWDPQERDAALTPEGVRQAWTLRAERLADRCDAIACSPLLRCRSTLTLLLGDAGQRARVWLDDRLMEPQGEAIVNRRAEWEELKAAVPASWDLGGVGLQNPYDLWAEGERGNPHFDARVRAWTEEACRRWPGRRVLVVTHHDWIAAWFRLFGSRTVSVANAGVIEGSWG